MRCSLLMVAFVLMVVLIAVTATAEAELVVDFVMTSDPEFREPQLEKQFKPEFKDLWLQALQRPEADYQRMAAETVARGHEYGIPNLIELAPTLEGILTEPASHPSARFAAARALIVLESRPSAAKLMEMGLKYDADLRQQVEPALARWDFAPARVVWRKRFESSTTFPRDLVLALRGLGRVRDEAALPAILKIAVDLLRPANIRLEAARAAGEIAEVGLEADADRLAHDSRLNPAINRWCAVSLLSKQTSEPARSTLLELAGNSEQTLVAAALQRLLEIDPELVIPLADQAVRSSHPQVREAVANAFLLRPSPDRIQPLARLLDDDHPTIRKLVAEGLYRLAENPEFAGAIRAEAMQVLRGDRWQGQVQAMLLLGMLDHKPAADRFVEYLESTRPDVMIHAAWGLRKLAVTQTIPAILDKLERQTIERSQRSIPGVDEQVAHLFEACGKMQAQESEPLCMRYVPRDHSRTKDLSRSAAIWALGNLHARAPDSSLGDALISRILDTNDNPFESPLVKQMAVVALVRMKASEFGAELKGSLSLHKQASSLDLATRWGVRELTGEELPPPEPRKFPQGRWFLEPLDPVTVAPEFGPGRSINRQPTD